MRHLRRLTSAVAFSATLAAMLLASTPARAGADEVAAEALFVEAKRLAAEGKFAEACPKFAESNRLDRGAGTLIHLADCYEKNNQSASAWATFKDAASAAQALGRADWQKLATTRAAALEPKLAKLTIKVQEPADKIEVTRDGSAMSQASWSTAIPIDVGVHTISASAPGRKPFKAQVMITNDGDRKEVVVTKLEVLSTIAGGTGTAPANTTAVDTGKKHPDDGAGQRMIGYVVGGIGIVGLAVGGVTGLIAIGKDKDSKKDCPNDGACTVPAAVSANDSARTFGTVSTIAFIAGGVGVAAGAILIFTAPKNNDRSGSTSNTKKAARGINVVPSTDGRTSGVLVTGFF
jgi:hypothetical protein